MNKKICMMIFFIFTFLANAKGMEIKDEVVYEFKNYPEKVTSNNYSLKDFFMDSNVEYLELSPMNKFFVPGTILSNTDKYRSPYNGDAILFKELPSKNKLRVLIFAYWDRNDQDSYFNLPSLELQVFNSDWELTDKLIIVDGASSECSFFRTAKIYKDLSFQLIDINSCWDMDKDILVVNSLRKHNYHITQDGKINSI